MTESIETRSIALTGDCLLTRPLSIHSEDQFLKIREILTGADAAFTNFDSAVSKKLEKAFAQRPVGGYYMTTEPHLLSDLLWMGITMVACGSTHADDYGPQGFIETIREFDKIGMVHAGSGRHLAEARAPAFQDTKNGRFALLAASASVYFGSRAGEQRYDTAGWPGVNQLRNKAVYQVDASTLEDLRRIGKDIGWDIARERAKNQGDPHAGGDDPNSYNFVGQTFTLADECGRTSQANAKDVAENLRQIKHAKLLSDIVIASLHCHEQGGASMMTATRRVDVEDTADFAIEYGRRCIDAGADIFAGHGSQLPLSIEIYKGKPIFHGLGTFIFEPETIEYLPAEAYERYGLDGRAVTTDWLNARYKGDTVGHTGNREQWEQAFAVVDFAGDVLKEIRVYPIDLGHKRPRWQRGRPIMAEGDLAVKILERIQRLSARFGTDLRIENGIGVIRGPWPKG